MWLINSIETEFAQSVKAIESMESISSMIQDVFGNDMAEHLRETKQAWSGEVAMKFLDFESNLKASLEEENQIIVKTIEQMSSKIMMLKHAEENNQQLGTVRSY